MGFLDWLKRATTTPRMTKPINRDGLLDLEARTRGLEDDIRLFGTADEAEAAIRKACICIGDMIEGIRFSRLETREEKYRYEVYKSESSHTALRFLRSIPSDKIPKLYYVIVETPAGNLGRDNSGMFDETTGKEIGTMAESEASTRAAIVFGPSALEANSDLCQRLREQGFTVFLAETAKGLAIPPGTLSPCVLSFEHCVPPIQGHGSRDEITKKWCRLLERTIRRRTGLNRSQWSMEWHGLKDGGEMRMLTKWPSATAEVCAKITMEIELAYIETRDGFCDHFPSQ